MGGMNGMGGGGGQGTLQALLTELSGLKKPRGLLNRWGRRALGMRPKPPPKYRILVMMATNMPEALDEALLRPGRIDRIYRVGYPSKAGRVRTYEGYLEKVSHELTPEQVDKLATITPYATGATIKDLVNEALIIAIRDGREIITWKDVIRAKQLKDLGPPEDVEYIERERHAVAVHEACHAVVAFRTRQHMEIDIATIEKGSDYLGMVASIPPEDQFTRWRSEYESDILVSLASLAGERMFFDGDSSSGVSGDLESATAVASFMEGYWGMGHTVSSYSTARRLEVGSPGGGRGGPPKGESTEKVLRAALADRIEDQLAELLTKAEEILRENRLGVLALAHALETHKTLSGEDVEAVLDQRTGVTVDGTVYSDPEFIAQLEAYHEAAAGAHVGHTRIDATMPEGGRLEPPPVPEVPEPVGAGYGYGQPQGYGAPAPGNGQGHQGPWHGAPGYGYPPPGATAARATAAAPATAARRVTPRRRPSRAGVGLPLIPTRPPRATARPARRPEPGPTRLPGYSDPAGATAPPHRTTGRPRPPSGIRRSRCTASRRRVRCRWWASRRSTPRRRASRGSERPRTTRSPGGPVDSGPASGGPASGGPASGDPAAVGPAKHGRATRTAKPSTARPPSPSRATTTGPARRRSPARPDRHSARAPRSSVRHRDGGPIGRAPQARVRRRLPSTCTSR